MTVNKSLIDLTRAKIEAAKMLEALEGEVTPTFDAFLNGLDQDFRDKADGYHAVITELEAHAQHFATLAAEFKKKSKVIENAADRLRDRIKETMAALGEKRIDGDLYSWVLSECKPKVLIDEGLTTLKYHNLVETWVPDKQRIREALEQGEVIPGASLQPVKALRAVVNTRALKGK